MAKSVKHNDLKQLLNMMVKYQLSCSYAWPHTLRLVMGMLIMPLGLMYVHRLLYVIRCFRVMICLRFQLCWRLYKRLSFSFLLLVFLEFLCQGEFPPQSNWISRCSQWLLHGYHLHTLCFLSFFSIQFNFRKIVLCRLMLKATYPY